MLFSRRGLIQPTGIRRRILIIALVPALLTELGLVAYFTHAAIDRAEQQLHQRADVTAEHLADTLHDTWAGGDARPIQRLLLSERTSDALSYIRVTDVQGRLVAESGAPPGTSDSHYLGRRAIRLPADEAGAASGADRLLGQIEVGIERNQIAAHKRDMLLRAALLIFAALILTGMLAWRLSNRLSGQIGKLGTVVGRLARGEFSVRAQPADGSEIGMLAAGVNDMAETLEAHHSEMEKRIADATAELANRMDSAERAHVAKSRFFAAASHDLRQPMHALSLFVTALKARNRQPEVAELVDHIEDATAAMEVLFNSLLDISRLDAGVIEAHPQHFPLQRLLDDLNSQFAPVAAEKGLRFRVRSCGAHLYSDPLLLERVLINLVANAIRYTDDGGVLVGCRRVGEHVRIGVWDTGRGIAQDQQQVIFQEFVQLQNPERDRGKGLGLGLAIVSRLGRLLHHRVEVRSQPGSGSAFTIDVPPGNPRLAQSPAAPMTASALPANALVVLIDDETPILHGMTELFDNWKIDLVAAQNTDDALQWLAGIGRVPDVIVSDYRLPGDTDGLEVIARLRQHFGREIPAILVSGDTAPDTIQRISQAGFPILHKPLRPAKLRALLTHLVQQNRARAVG